MGKTVKPPPTPNFMQAATDQTTVNKDAALYNAKLGNANYNDPMYTQSIYFGEGNNPTPTITTKYADTNIGVNSELAARYQAETENKLAQVASQSVTKANETLSRNFNPLDYKVGNVGTYMDPLMSSVSAGTFSPGIQLGNASSGITMPTNASGIQNYASSYKPNSQLTNSIFDTTSSIQRGPSGYEYGSAQGGPTLASLRGSLDESKIAKMPVDSGTTGQQAIMSRLQPQIDRQRKSLETQLINQGLRPGDQAYTAAINLQGQQENDALQQAALQGISLDTAANQQGFGQAQARASLQNEAALSGYGAGVTGTGLANQAIAQNFSQGSQAQQQQNAAQQQAFQQRIQSGEFGNQAQLASFGMGLQSQDQQNQAASVNQQMLNAQTELQAQLRSQGFSEAQASQAAQNTAMQQNYANQQTQQQSKNQAVAQQFNQNLQANQFLNAAQQQAMSQAIQQRQLPLNEITALMSGQQIQNPTFQPYQGASAQAGDIQAATGAQAGWDQNIYNQQVAQRNAMIGAIGGLAGMAAAPVSAGLTKKFG